MISLDAAILQLLADVGPLGEEAVALEAALGRTLAAPVIARRDQPPHATSAMDGYAVRSADAVAGARLTVVGTAYAGAPFDGMIGSGEAVRIATGGLVPDGADRIVIQEVISRDGDAIVIDSPLHEASFVRAAGGDYRAGDVLIDPGEGMSAARIGLAAAAGEARLMVRRRPRIALFSTGNELRRPGDELGPGDVVDSAGPAITALITQWGGLVDRRGVLPDDRQRSTAMIAAAPEADVMLFIGGASVGDRDVVRGAVGDLGGRMKFDRIAIQPGKPCWHARLDDGRMVLGLPGNPASAFVCAFLLLRPLIDAMLGRPRLKAHFASLAVDLPAVGARETWWRAHVTTDASGQSLVTPDPRGDSSLQRPLAQANALLRQPPETALAMGQPVEVVLIES